MNSGIKKQTHFMPMPNYYPTKFKIGDIVVYTKEFLNHNKIENSNKMRIIDMQPDYIAPIIIFDSNCSHFGTNWAYEGNLILLSSLRQQKIKRLLI